MVNLRCSWNKMSLDNFNRNCKILSEGTLRINIKEHMNTGKYGFQLYLKARRNIPTKKDKSCYEANWSIGQHVKNPNYKINHINQKN